MKRKKPKSHSAKQMKRPARLESAKTWIPSFTGKRLLGGYCKHFGVNWRCAVIELRMLGIVFDPAYIAARERADAEQCQRRRARREKKRSAKHAHWHPFTDPFSAYLAGDFAALHELQMQERYGDNWEQLQLDMYTGEPTVDYESVHEYDSSETFEEPSIVDSPESEDWIPF